jgi:hypothetical protein
MYRRAQSINYETVTQQKLRHHASGKPSLLNTAPLGYFI